MPRAVERDVHSTAPVSFRVPMDRIVIEHGYKDRDFMRIVQYVESLAGGVEVKGRGVE